MSYNAVPTVSTGDVWTATNHNLYIRDNFRAIVPDVVTTKGQLVIGDGIDALALLGVNSDNNIFLGDMSWEKKTKLLQICSGNGTPKDLSEGGSGNLHIPTDFDVPEGSNFIYCNMEFRHSATTAYFALHPSHDTTLTDMRVETLQSSTCPNTAQSHGIMPLDSTGGLFYTVTDTVDLARLYVYAWMY